MNHKFSLNELKRFTAPRNGLANIVCAARRFLLVRRCGGLILLGIGLVCIAAVSGCASVPNCGDAHKRNEPVLDKTERAIISAEQNLASLLRVMDSLRYKRAKLDCERGERIPPVRVETEMKQARDLRMSDEEYLKILKQCYEDLLRRVDAKDAELGVYLNWVLSFGAK
ncbi:MAG TPA: hypothetical protein VN673_06795 [Clostridia bacterium]|nr:hypothetical protein [Clostridia bacterium]